MGQTQQMLASHYLLWHVTGNATQLKLRDLNNCHYIVDAHLTTRLELQLWRANSRQSKGKGSERHAVNSKGDNVPRFNDGRPEASSIPLLPNASEQTAGLTRCRLAELTWSFLMVAVSDDSATISVFFCCFSSRCLTSSRSSSPSSTADG